MAKKTETTKQDIVYSFSLTHEDIREMMNDPQVLLDEGDVSDDQEFQIILKKANGSEIILKDMVDGDTLIMRFNKVTVETAEETFDAIDIINS